MDIIQDVNDLLTQQKNLLAAVEKSEDNETKEIQIAAHKNIIADIELMLKEIKENFQKMDTNENRVLV